MNDGTEIEPFINLLKTFMIQVVLKAEKYQDQEIPKKQISQIIDSIEQDKVKIAILDVLQATLDPGLGKLRMGNSFIVKCVGCIILNVKISKIILNQQYL